MEHMNFRDIGLPKQDNNSKFQSSPSTHSTPDTVLQSNCSPPSAMSQVTLDCTQNSITEYTDAPSPHQIHHALATITALYRVFN
jgi:hypothetical protein